MPAAVTKLTLGWLREQVCGAASALVPAQDGLARPAWSRLFCELDGEVQQKLLCTFLEPARNLTLATAVDKCAPLELSEVSVASPPAAAKNMSQTMKHRHILLTCIHRQGSAHDIQGSENEIAPRVSEEAQELFPAAAMTAPCSLPRCVYKALITVMLACGFELN